MITDISQVLVLCKETCSIFWCGLLQQVLTACFHSHHRNGGFVCTLPEKKHFCTWKWMVGIRLFPFGDGHFSVAMLVYQRVDLPFKSSMFNPITTEIRPYFFDRVAWGMDSHRIAGCDMQFSPTKKQLFTMSGWKHAETTNYLYII